MDDLFKFDYQRSYLLYLLIGDPAVCRQLLDHFHELAGSVQEVFLKLLVSGLRTDREDASAISSTAIDMRRMFPQRLTAPMVPSAHEIGDALADGHGGNVGVGAHAVGHDGRIGNAQVFEAVHSAVLIDDGH